MDKAIVLNVFDFVSFHVCKTLLEKGIEVKGIHTEDNVKEPFFEEKRLEIGRNANFEEHSILEWGNKEKRDTTNTTVIFSLYDLFMLYKESILLKETVTQSILDLMEQSEGVVMILPSQMLNRLIDSQPLMNLQSFLDQVKGLGVNLQLIYLPTVYGPWQPETFLFQQSLLTKINRNKGFKGIREEMKDALYIEDAVESIFEIMASGKPGSYLLESGRKKHWNRCADYLELDENKGMEQEADQINSKISKVTVKKVTSVSESLSKQTEHTQRLYSGY